MFQGQAGPVYKKERNSYRATQQRARSEGDRTMTAEFQVQKAGLAGQNWKTVCRANEAKAREIFHRQLRLYSIGRFRILDGDGKVIEEQKAYPLFSNN